MSETPAAARESGAGHVAPHADMCDGHGRPLLLDLTGAAHGGTAEGFRAAAIKAFQETWELSELCLSVFRTDAGLMIHAEPLRHPQAFYLAHTAAFAITKLVFAGLLQKRIDPCIESQFLVGVDEISWDSTLQPETRANWPPVAALHAYRARAKAAILDMLRTVPIVLPITWESPLWVIPMIINHERIHLETSAVITRQVPLDALKCVKALPVCPDQARAAPENQPVPVPAGTVRIGRDRDGAIKHYGWDIEFGTHTEELPAFHMSKYQVSNGEYAAFVAAGGYERPEYWHGKGALWRESSAARHPRFWVPVAADGGGDRGETAAAVLAQFRLRTLTTEIAMPASWPVLVNHFEAAAFCAWLAKTRGRPIRLPTETEWLRAYEHALAGRAEYPEWGTAPPGNIDMRYWASECPVDQFPALDGGLCGMVGNAWSWCDTPSDALRGYQPHPLYPDFSLPCNAATRDAPSAHFIIKGGSWASTGNNGALARSRFAFRPHFYQFASFVYVETERAPLLPSTPLYESDRTVAQYLDFHYGAERRLGVPNFNVAVASVCIEWAHRLNVRRRRCLDLGCAVGRAVFELARSFDHVLGVEFSAYFCQICEQIKQKNSVSFPFFLEGDITELVTYRADGYTPEERARTTFLQGDACNLRPEWTDYDLVLAANLIDRLPDPAVFLHDIKSRIVPGGVLVVTSPYTWLTEHTPARAWIGGYYDGTGRPHTSLSGLLEHLQPEFRLLAAQDVPMVIRDTARKHQYTIVHLTVWQRLDSVAPGAQGPVGAKTDASS